MKLFRKTKIQSRRERIGMWLYHLLRILDGFVYTCTFSYLSSNFAMWYLTSDTCEWFEQ